MSVKRKARLPVRPKSNGDKGKYLDYVSRAGTKAIAVGSEDKHNPLMTVVQAQLGGSRIPRDYYNPPNVIDIWEVNPNIKTTPLGKKWCSVCGEWVDKKGFSPKADNSDGLHSYCKECRNAQKRRHYWFEKEANKIAA